jgi:hypothetical protein
MRNPCDLEMPRAVALIAVLLSGLVSLAAAPARADSGPVIVIPSRPGIPIVINGVDASYAVVEGDWGLARPGAVPVTVIGGTPLHPSAVYQQRRAYHPKYGREPLRGRNEVEPPEDRKLPPPAESFSRNWSSSSEVSPPANEFPPQWQRVLPNDGASLDSLPPTINDPQPYVLPTVVVPRDQRRSTAPRGHRGANSELQDADK